METVIAIRIEERRKKAQEVQKLLTGFSGIIETRLGLKRDDGGVIILDVNGGEKAVEELDHFDSKEDIHTVECHGGGRMFPLDQELDTVFNQSLLELVRNVEKTGLGVTE